MTTPSHRLAGLGLLLLAMKIAACWSLRLLLVGLALIGVVVLAARPALAQDAQTKLDVRAYQNGAPKAAAEGAFVCPGDVLVGSQPLTIDFEVTTTSPNPVQYTATFAFSNQTLEGAVTSDTHGDPAPVVDGGTTTYTVEGLLSNTMPFRVSVVTTAAAVGPATTDWEVRRAGVIRQEEHCEFNVIEGGGGDEGGDLVLALDTLRGALDFDSDAKTATLPLGHAVRFDIQIINNGPDEATAVVVTGGGDPSSLEILDVLLNPDVGVCQVAQDFFSCPNLTVALGDTLAVHVTAAGVAETAGASFSTSTGHPDDPDFSNNDDGVALDIVPVGQAGSIEGTVFLDLDGDGVPGTDSLDVGLDEQLVFLDLNYNQEYDADTDASTTSDADGIYRFENLPQVVLDVGIATLAGWTFTIPADGFQTVNLNEDPDQEDVNFGTRPRAGAILGVKWEDQDADGRIDEDEPRLEDWHIYLDLNNNGMLDDGEPSDSTDGSGLYAIGDLDPGTYVVREVQQEGFVQTFPKDPDHYTVTLGPGEFVGGKRFGNRAVSSIHGVAYEDLNNNGQRDEGEPGIDGLRITLLDAETGVLVAETMTMAMGDTLHGVYWLEDVPPGIYDLFQVRLPFFIITEPGEVPGLSGPINFHRVFLGKGERKDSLNFGNFFASDLSIFKLGPFSSARVGSLIIYSLDVENGLGAHEAPNTIVQDVLDPRLAYVSATTTQGSCSFAAASRTVTCDLGTLAPGSHVEISITARVLEQGEGPLVNEATVASSHPDLSFRDNSSEHNITVVPRSLDISKEVSSQDVAVGDTLTYTIIAKQRASTVAVNPSITDTLSEKVAFISITKSRPDLSCRFEAASRAVICDPFILRNSRPDTIRVKVVAVRPGTCPNIATVINDRRQENEEIEMHADTVVVTITGDEPTPTEPEAEVPETFMLYDNYPNPFNPETVIRFDVPHRARVRLRVFDVLGRVVATLVDREMPPGSHQALFNASGLPSGPYFYRMTAGAYSAARSMVLLK